MRDRLFSLIDTLESQHALPLEEYAFLAGNPTDEAMKYAAEKACRIRKEIYGNSVYVRGLIEFTNICKNDCLYCGIRRSNHHCSRYRLTRKDILSCCEAGYQLGFRTFVLQGGEDRYWTDEVLIPLLQNIKERYPDCAITLSIGERSKESYQKLFDAGAERYLLRHETTDAAHYEKLHPKDLSLSNRMHCLWNLKGIGYQTGCGFMVGSPFQTPETLAMDLKFIEEFSPDMCGIGPFIPHKETPFKNQKAGSLKETLWLLSLIRLIVPHVLLPATTALSTIHPQGREMGILAGANVVMPNLSPVSVRKNYELYNNKSCTDEESAECLNSLKKRIKAIGYQVATDRGDVNRD